MALMSISNSQVTQASKTLSIPGCKLTEKGAIFNKGLSFEEWQAIGGTLRYLEKSVLFWIGDWINYGEKNYGETYTQAIEVTGYDQGTLQNAAWVASNVEISRRRENVSFSHHQEVASLDSKKQDEFLEKASTQNMSRKELRQAIQKEKHAKVLANQSETPRGQFAVISIDPPWPYGTEYDEEGRRAASPYPEMPLEDIKAIALPSSEHCVLWLWTTHKFMRYSFEILDHWGFRDVAILTWVKDRMGLGVWLRSQSEFCIMCVKGKPAVDLTNQTTIIHGPLREHSRKPDEFYAMVDKLCVGRKLDYFSRQKREGWELYGNETTKF